MLGIWKRQIWYKKGSIVWKIRGKKAHKSGNIASMSNAREQKSTVAQSATKPADTDRTDSSSRPDGRAGRQHRRRGDGGGVCYPGNNTPALIQSARRA